jgi:hypothetical protein
MYIIHVVSDKIHPLLIWDVSLCQHDLVSRGDWTTVLASLISAAVFASIFRLLVRSAKIVDEAYLGD